MKSLAPFKFVLTVVCAVALALATLALLPSTELTPQLTPQVDAAEKAAGILICFPWEDVGCNVEGRCFAECENKTLRIRACQVCTSTGCTFSHYERSCSTLFCA